jgi:hypothetical protein
LDARAAFSFVNFLRRARKFQLLFCGVEAKADVIGDPVAVGIAEDGFEEGYGLGEDGGAVCGVELVEDSVAEGVEP